MKILFSEPIIEEDSTRTAITIDHVIIYPERTIVINNKDGSNKILPIDGLPQDAIDAITAFLSSLAAPIRSEYETKEISIRSAERAIIQASETSTSPTKEIQNVK